jgi:hypothetical protein
VNSTISRRRRRRNNDKEEFFTDAVMHRSNLGKKQFTQLDKEIYVRNSREWNVSVATFMVTQSLYVHYTTHNY